MGPYSKPTNSVQLRLYDREGQKFFVLLDRNRLRHGIVHLLAEADDNAIVNGALVKAIETALIYSGEDFGVNCPVSGGTGNTMEVYFRHQPDQRVDEYCRERESRRETRRETWFGKIVERIEIWCERWFEAD